MRRASRRGGVLNHPTTSDRDYSDEEREFLLAIEAYKTRTGRKFPTWCEALDVLRSLGYAKAPPEDRP